MNYELFKNPPMLFRNAPFWSWNDRLDRDELKRQMDEMLEKGWGSAFMHSRVGLVTGYLSDEWMDLTLECVRHAKEKGMSVWLYDEDKWPSGFAGGQIPEMNKEFRPRALLLLNPNEVTQDDTILEEIDQNDCKKYICKRVASLGNVWFNGSSYVDLMNPRMVEAFLESTHEKYKEVCGEYFGKEIPGIFTDEPCYNYNTFYDKPFVPWSEYLPDYFKQLKGYKIQEHLKELFFESGDYHKTRFDFYDSVTRLFIESFSKKYFNWCDKNNLKLTGHYMAEDNLISQTKWIGAAMPHYEFMHWPGIDKLSKNIKQHVTVKQLTSAAEQLGKERTLSEVFGCIGHDSSFFHRKWITDWQAVLGINFVNSHLSLYSMRGERKRDYPSNLFFQQPWWEDEKHFSDYTARLNYALTQGRRDINILVLHPISSIWSEISPLHGGYDSGYNDENYDYLMEKAYYDRPFSDLSKKLLENKLDFHYGDEMIMENHGRIENSKLVIGNHSYSTVVLPPILNIREHTLNLLKEFALAAGSENIIFMDRIPSRVDGETASLNLPEGCLLFDGVEKVIEKLDSIYDNRVKIIDKSTGKNAGNVWCQKRKIQDGSLLFIANTDEKRETDMKIVISSRQIPILCDLMTGIRYKIPYYQEKDSTYIECKLSAAGSAVIAISGQEAGICSEEVEDVPCCLGSGIVFEKACQVQEVIDAWSVNIPNHNVLPLHKATLYINNEKVSDTRHVAFYWHEAFYKLEEGAPFKAEYSFEVKDIPEGELFAVIEMAENLDCIQINGCGIHPLKARGEKGCFNSDKSWLDANFTKVPLKDKLVIGTNVLTIEGKKSNNITNPGSHCSLEDYKNHQPTELETVYIIGDFSVDGEAYTDMYIEKNKGIRSLEVTRSGYPFYAGQLEYCSNFQVARKLKSHQKLYLKILQVEAASVRVQINGQYVDVGYMKPFVFDITRYLVEGKNEIKVIASNTLFNLMGPNWISAIDSSIGVSPWSFIDFQHYTDQFNIKPFGIGGAAILSEK